jgi:hypothetical protein
VSDPVPPWGSVRRISQTRIQCGARVHGCCLVSRVRFSCTSDRVGATSISPSPMQTGLRPYASRGASCADARAAARRGLLRYSGSTRSTCVPRAALCAVVIASSERVRVHERTAPTWTANAGMSSWMGPTRACDHFGSQVCCCGGVVLRRWFNTAVGESTVRDRPAATDAAGDGRDKEEHAMEADEECRCNRRIHVGETDTTGSPSAQAANQPCAEVF